MEDDKSPMGQDIVCMHKRPAFSAKKERPPKCGRLILRHTHAEREAWQSWADACGLTLSEFMRAAANTRAGVAPAPRRKQREQVPDAVRYALVKIGTNINQQTHAMNTLLLAGETPPPDLAASHGV